MSQDSQSLKKHYHQPDLISKILTALTKAGLDPDHLDFKDLDLLAEFHLGGRQATRELAALAQLQSCEEILDLGCGVGGPARLLAREFGCQVVGLDLISTYCQAATELTRRLGYCQRVRFLQGDMRDMPFLSGSFDRVWSQHTLMNICHKDALIGEIQRVLRPGGKVLLYEICAGNGDQVHLPVPWASSAEHSFLCPGTDLRDLFTNHGFREDSWEDLSRASLDWLRTQTTAKRENGTIQRRLPGLALLMGPDAGLKSRNLARNLAENRVTVIRAAYVRE